MMMRQARSAVVRTNARFMSSVPALSASPGGSYPLTEEFPGVPKSRGGDLPVPTPQVTTLPNGLKVASLDNNDMTTTVGVVVGMGTRNETSATAGACHLLKYAAFGQTANRSALRLVRDLEELGSTFSASHGRESFGLTASCMRHKLGGVMDAVAESVRQPTLKIWELRDRANAMIDDTADNGNTMADALHAAAFYDTETLGNPLYPATARLHDGEALMAFRSAYLVPSNMVVVGASVNHQDLVKVATEQFGDMASGSAPAPVAAEFVGGETRVAAGGPTQVGVAFPVAAADAAAAAVLAEVLGSGESTPGVRSIGGGNTSRMAALVGDGTVSSAQGVSYAYSDSGLVGVTATATGSGLAAFQSVAAAFKAAASGVDDAECARAKARLTGKLQAQMESGDALVQEMATDVLATGGYQTAAQQIAAIDAVSTAQVKGVAAAALKAAPAVATIGDITAVPRHNKLAALFQ